GRMSRGPLRQKLIHSALRLRGGTKISRCNWVNTLRQESISRWAARREQALVKIGQTDLRRRRIARSPSTKRRCGTASEIGALGDWRLLSCAGKFRPWPKIYIAKA